MSNGGDAVLEQAQWEATAAAERAEALKQIADEKQREAEADSAGEESRAAATDAKAEADKAQQVAEAARSALVKEQERAEAAAKAEADKARPRAAEATPAKVQGKNLFGSWTAPKFEPGGWSGGFVLLLLIALTTALAIALLSATQIQSRLAALNINGRLLSAAQIADLSERWHVRAAIAAAQSREVDRAAGKAARASQEALASENALEAANRNLSAAVADLAQALRPKNVVIAFDERASPEQRDEQARKIVESQKGDVDVTAQVTAVSSRLDELDKARKQRDDTAAKHNKALEELGSRAKAFSDATQAVPLFGTRERDEALDPTLRSRIENSILEYNDARGRFFRGFVYRLARMPVEAITLWLVVALGALGAALHLGSLYLKNTEIFWSSVFFMPAFGAVMALVVFVFVKAGVLVVATAPDQVGEASVNPYFTGFIAIISGLLAEQALLALRSAGARLFSADLNLGQPPQRWARANVAEKLDPKNEDKMTLVAEAVGMPRAAIDGARAKVQGRIRATWDEQRIIAALANLDVRDAFSDIPSADATDAGTAGRGSG